MNASLRIAMFVGSFPVVSETFISRQIAGLLELGHDVRIFANARPGSGGPVQPEVARYDLLRRTTYVNGPEESVVWEMPVSPLMGRTWPPGGRTPIRNWSRWLRAAPSLLRCVSAAPHLTMQALRSAEYGYQARSLSMLYRLATLCSAGGGYDVLHAHFGPVANSFRFARALWNAPLVVTFHGYDFSTLPRREGIGLYRRLFDVVDRVTVNSEHTRGEIRKLGCPNEKIRKLPVGLDPAEFPFKPRVWSVGEPVRVLTVGRLVEKKGLEFSIRAVARVQEKHPDLHYDIIGDGPLRAGLAGLIGQLGRSGKIALHGARDVEFVRQKMAEAHVFVLASVTAADGDQEGQGLVLQEAQASGLPVLATRHAGLPEGIQEGRSGLLVPERDVDALAAGLEFLLSRSGDWPEMGRSGRALVEDHYDIRKLNRALVDIYADAGEAYRRHRSPK